ncbi:translation initiation factor IF-3 [Ostreibacterium oceani]|uniref:Translation initiation factor IF-3 n=1 Tax=Ostreibacterium oceani TaxID=2654998 RepID=A0A6N7EXV7_9GAMM|nr:translation initiation factor IF-3 [Ostreibacterium oceani]
MAKEQETRINEAIKDASVRLIDENGEQLGVVPIADALSRAESVELDLVEIAANKDGVICKIMDYGKYRYELQKKKAEAKKKQKQIQVKEVKFRPGTDVGDYQVKLRNLIRFLEDGDKVKITIRFRGREMAHQELGAELLKRLESDLAEYGATEQKADMQGRQMTMVMAPTKKK